VLLWVRRGAAGERSAVERRRWFALAGAAGIFLCVGGETRANKNAITAFRARWQQPTSSELVLSVDPQSVMPPEADLGRHQLAIESTESLPGSEPPVWTLVTNLASGLDQFTVRWSETNRMPALFRLRLAPP